MPPLDMFCDGGLKNEPVSCLGCHLVVKSQDCLQFHKRYKCSSIWKCLDCEQILRVGTKRGEKEIQIEAHQAHCRVWGGVRVGPWSAEDPEY